MKNIFRSDSEMITSRFVWQQASPKNVADQIKELGDLEVADVNNDGTKEALKNLSMSKDLLEAEITVPESAVKAKIDEVKGLLERYKTLAGEKEAEVDVIAVLNAIENEVVRTYVAAELGIKLENFEAIDADAEFDAEEMEGEKADQQEVVKTADDQNKDAEIAPETLTDEEAFYEIIFQNYLQLNKTSPKTLKLSLVKEMKEDLEAAQKKEGKKVNTSVLFGGEKSDRKQRLIDVFPEEMEANDFGTIEMKIDAIDETNLWNRLQTRKERASETTPEGIKNLKEAYEELQRNREIKDGVPTKQGQEYLNAVKDGYVGTFDEWNDKKPRSTFEGFFYRLVKSLKEGDFGKKLAKWFPGLSEWLGIKEEGDEEVAEKLESCEAYKALEAKEQEMIKAEKIAENKKAWFEIKGSTDPADKTLFNDFETFRGENKEMFAFLDGIGDQEALSKVDKSENMPTDFGSVSIENFKAWKANTKAMEVLAHFKEKGATGVLSLESWQNIVDKATKGEITINEAGNVEYDPGTGSVKIIDEWSENGIEEGLKLPEAEKVYNDHKAKFDVEFKDIPTGKGLFADKTEKKEFSSTFISLLEKVPSEAWGSYKMTKKDLENFEYRVGDSPVGGRKNFDKGRDAFYTDFNKGGKFFYAEPGKGEKGKWYSKLSADEMKKESACVFGVQGTGNMLARDYKFENAKAFFNFLSLDNPFQD